jgi:hypothetical protein
MTNYWYAPFVVGTIRSPLSNHRLDFQQDDECQYWSRNWLPFSKGFLRKSRTTDVRCSTSGPSGGTLVLFRSELDELYCLFTYFLKLYILHVSQTYKNIVVYCYFSVLEVLGIAEVYAFYSLLFQFNYMYQHRRTWKR